nr:MAG TPA: Preprotein translocase subunit [Caudoviricetes sp.]
MNYEFHVGDYVETVGGFVGWISHVDRNYITMVSNDGITSGPWSIPDEQYHFKRIGAYDFTKKEKKKIMRLSEDDSWLTFINTNKTNVNLCYIIKRINELVDTVNLLLDKSTES